MEDESVWLKLGRSKKAAGAWLRDHVYPVVIALASLLVLIFVPMIGTDASIGALIPTDASAAVLFWVLKGLTVALNLAIFSAFRKQAKLDVRDNANYKEACEILSKHKPREYKPLSPVKFGAKQWVTKGITLALSTAVTTVALTNIILRYDWVSAVSCAVSIIIAIIFGLLNMASEEAYWTDDFLQYAKTVNLEEENKKDDKNITPSEEVPQNDQNTVSKDNKEN